MRGLRGYATALPFLLALSAWPAPAAAAEVAAVAAPENVIATNGATTISLTWTQPRRGSAPVSFRVYEGSTVVARNTTTHVTIANLPFSSAHTYTVTAVDGRGRESRPSAPVSRTTFLGGAIPPPCFFPAPTNLTATAVSASAVVLTWSYVPRFTEATVGPFTVREGSAVLATTPHTSLRIGGLAPGSTHTYRVAHACDHPGPPALESSVTVTTAAGPARRPGTPTALTADAITARSVRLSWTAQAGDSATAGYAVHLGATRVARTTGTSVTVTGLWRQTVNQFTVAAVDAAGNESAHSAPVRVSTLPCDGRSTAPVRVSAQAVSSSSVRLSWVQVAQARSFTVLLGGAGGEPVATVATPAAMITGLPPATTVSFAVVAQLDGCGTGPPSAPVSATTNAGSSARPPAPADLRVTNIRLVNPVTGAVTLAWTQPAGTDPPVSYRIYEGATVLATAVTPGATLTLPGGPTHTVVVAGVDAAGNESRASQPVTFTVPFLPPP